MAFRAVSETGGASGLRPREPLTCSRWRRSLTRRRHAHRDFRCRLRFRYEDPGSARRRAGAPVRELNGFPRTRRVKSAHNHDSRTAGQVAVPSGSPRPWKGGGDAEFRSGACRGQPGLEPARAGREDPGSSGRKMATVAAAAAATATAEPEAEPRGGPGADGAAVAGAQRRALSRAAAMTVGPEADASGSDGDGDAEDAVASSAESSPGEDEWELDEEEEKNQLEIERLEEQVRGPEPAGPRPGPALRGAALCTPKTSPKGPKPLLASAPLPGNPQPRASCRWRAVSTAWGVPPGPRQRSKGG